MYFKNIIICSFVTAILASILFSLYQTIMVTPIILHAEVFELAETTGQPEPWAPEDGLERTLFTLSANFLISFAYALILLSAMSTRNAMNLTQGVWWGLAGYFCFFVAPGLGLSPEIPGMEAAALEARQIWWLITVLFSAAGLWLLVFANKFFKLLALLLISTPHLIGAPQPNKHGFANSDPVAVEKLENLWHQFILQTSIANALLWLIIGIVSAWLAVKFIMPLYNHPHS